MNKLELQAQADELQMQLNALSEKIANCKDEPKMFPQEGERYWYSDVDGTVMGLRALDSKGRLNVFRTEAEAQKAVGVQWAKQRVAHRIAILNDGWVPDWNSSAPYKYYIRHSISRHTKLDTDAYASVKMQPDYMCCKSREVAEQIIEECRDDLLLIFSE